VVNYYLLAGDAWRLHALRWNAETSMLKTLAAKHKSTVSKMAARYKATIETPHGLRTCFEARLSRNGKKDLVARFGGIPLRRSENGFIADPVPVLVPTPRKELIHRLRTRRCELCGQGATVAVHQIAKLAQLGTSGPGQPAWAALMARKRRKTLVVCQPCHELIHATPVTHAA
jgi:Type II intron maturase